MTCTACNRAPARVTFDGSSLCPDCASGAYHEALSAPDCDDGVVAFVAMSAARLIASYPARDYVLQFGMAGIRDDVFPALTAALLFHGLHLELDAPESLAEVADLDALSAWAHRVCVGAEIAAVLA